MIDWVTWAVFLALSVIAVGAAAGMLLAFSMYRAGLALMTSFVALAGLFILLGADLLAAIQIMMNVGGMMVMVLFMVMLMPDPGGEMMRDMKTRMHLPGPGAFSMGMPKGPPPSEDGHDDKTHQGHATGDQQHSGDGEHIGNRMAHITPPQRYHMMLNMAMSTAQLPWAFSIGVALAVVLIALILLTPWPSTPVLPTQDATVAVGELLLSRYMIGFEGAAFLILGGIASAVILGKREHLPVTAHDREHAEEAEVCTCPMHAEVRQVGPGQCSICGMGLVPEREMEVAHTP